MKLHELALFLRENEGRVVSITLTKAAIDELRDDCSYLWQPEPESIGPWWLGTIDGVRIFQEQPEC